MVNLLFVWEKWVLTPLLHDFFGPHFRSTDTRIFLRISCVGVSLVCVCVWEKGVLTPPPSNGRISSCPVNVHLHACNLDKYILWCITYMYFDLKQIYFVIWTNMTDPSPQEMTESSTPCLPSHHHYRKFVFSPKSGEKLISFGKENFLSAPTVILTHITDFCQNEALIVYW